MKKVFILVVVTLYTLTCFAEERIQDTFLGCKLGVSTKAEVEKALPSQGLSFESTDSVLYYYNGTYMHEDITFRKIIVQYIEDTLATIVLADSCEQYLDVSQSLISKLNGKYGQMTDALDSDVKQFFFKNFQIEDKDIWARTDDETAVVSAAANNKVLCIYMASGFLKRQAQRTASQLMKLLFELPFYNEDYQVHGVAGVKFGEDIATVKKAIGKKYGKYSPIQDTNKLTYTDITIGGTHYNFAVFYFKEDRGLVSVDMQSYFKTWQKDEAMMALDGIKSQYQNKYPNLITLKEDPDDVMYVCGSFLPDYKLPPISISLEKSLSRGGDIFYYVRVRYYESRLEHLYDDEI